MGNGPSNEWFSLGLNDLKPVRGKMSWSNIGDAVVVDVYSHALAQGQYATTFENHYIYWIEGSGRITIDHTVTPSGQLPEWLPKVGLEINLRNEFQQVKWFGRGPFETYPDRKTGAKVGVYQTSVPEMYEPYLIPQESGNRTDVRWFEFKNPQGTGIRISADHYSASALRNTAPIM
jgi:beta-galactosidase